MCGIVGIVAKTHVNQSIYDALTVLQHRGQDAAGIVTSDQGKFYLRKDNGLVRDVFRTRHMQRLIGRMGIGHVRYPTAGSSSSAEAQPFYVNSPYGIVLAHNGNLTNTTDLAQDLYREDLRHINTTSDSEVLLNIFAHELQEQKQLVPTPEMIFRAVRRVHERVRGGYAVVAMICGYGVVAFRDPNGIRPAVYGRRDTDTGPEYMVASESVALDALGFQLERDVEPGECVVMTEAGEIFTQQCADNACLTPCLFEQVYFARPDSIMDGIAVYKARLRMGEKLAEKIMREQPDHNIDVVIPIPDTSRSSAQELANRLGVKYREGFMKNRYIGRTFIMPGQQQRKKSVRQKLNALELEFRGKNVLLVDDSIVRGTTCEQIIEMARDAGALNVYFASAAPAVRYPNVYGIDMPAKEEFIAHGRTTDEIATAIGADWLIYQELDDLISACLEGSKTAAKAFDCSVFNGEYVTGDIDDNYFQRLSDLRSDSSKGGRKAASANNVAIDLHNEAES
ncbi:MULTISPECIES: amidophosphoribosyltransferase [unclassified Oceanobacter]|jgi:amidophosphoribosyltransferase|uniref:amidophosphoribosyltransferase n=1 Tax=unclassified Oceanobacter TaxID=2620260 RepID=UPI0026E312B9|nr:MULTISPECIES: amidophosphoribosyltransferase [unclassified Oceanobacter]MDO6683466.1 amidophosphoribosyltransferase [Oceanobacter sp. 5_MG-2023]MDP2507062.1 amidophosphoribosyltransferase [Oceanobacter sp. 3_MG-2023]MDP2548820.1 amidophosphoribosyltransferase [Oceanobacter sp. 4_MG-2023]MDP2609583.1 amidophosphoribosyltransferase [Oceanobacter sp. 1_MG-2023]MDP2612666.1 amidophosphoribosyltransferase [Oceanobacter sp. 2_MG-2023]